MKRKMISILAAFALALGMGVCLTACGDTAAIDLEDYVTVDVSGYNGHGTADYTFDKAAFERDYADAVKYKADDSQSTYAEMMNSLAVYSLADDIAPCGQFDVDEDLSNGDEVTLSWTFDTDYLESVYNVKLNGSSIRTKVKGLEEVEAIDVFSNVTVEFEGTAPDGTADISVDSTQYSASDFKIIPSEGLSNGDTITVEFSGSDTLSSRYGVVPAENTKTYTVEGLPSYVRSLSEIPDDAMEKMKSQTYDAFLSYVASDWADESHLNSVDYIGCYFLTPKDGFSTQNENKIYLVYRVNLTITRDNEDDIEWTYYTYYEYRDAVILADGTFSLDYSNYDRCSNSLMNSWYFVYGYSDLNTLFDKVVTADIENYNYESTVEE